MFNTVVIRFILLFLIYFDISESSLWSKGVVHYAINPKDYDLHSQDEIVSTFSDLEKEICVKFFNTPFNHNNSEVHKILYINNPTKQKNCPPQHYNYTGSIVNMPIGYKCINKVDIARMAIDMLKASIDPKTAPINSYDLVKRFEERDRAKPRPTFLSTDDRNYINAHYHGECSMLSQRAYNPSARRSAIYEREYGVWLGEQNRNWYASKVWPFGVVMYSVDESLRKTPNYNILKYAMTQIELNSCVVFHEISSADYLSPNDLLVFREAGEDEPELGYKNGEQVINLNSMTSGDPGHTAHALNNLMRTLGIPMMSNRYDRDNYVSIQWSLVKKGKERFLEKAPKDAWVMGIPYDFNSATHAPANYLCYNCPPGGRTVYPLQDVLWKRSLSMGHTSQLSDSDAILLNLVYEAQCKQRRESGSNV